MSVFKNPNISDIPDKYGHSLSSKISSDGGVGDSNVGDSNEGDSTEGDSNKGDSTERVKPFLLAPPLTEPTASYVVSPSLRTTFSPRLFDLIDEALVNNKDLQAAARRVESVLADKKISASDSLPHISAQFSTGKEEFFVAETNDARSESTAFYENFTMGLSVRWELDVWGKIRDGSTAAQRDVESQLFIYEAARQSLSANVLLSWLRALESKQLYALSQKSLFIQQQRLEQLERRLDQGLVEPLDVRLTRNNVASLEDKLLEQDADYQQSRRQLEVLLGRYPSAGYFSMNLLPEIQPFDPALTPRDILQLRPDILAAEHTLLAEKLRVKAAKKKLWPSLNLTGSYGNDDEDISSLFDFDRWLRSFSASLLQPVFQGGALRSAIAQREAREQLAVAQYEQLVLEAWSEVETYLYTEHIFKKRIIALEKAFNEAVAVESLTLRKYEQGLTRSFELVSAQNRSISAKLDLIRIRIGHVANRVRLHLALGVKLNN